MRTLFILASVAAVLAACSDHEQPTSPAKAQREAGAPAGGIAASTQQVSGQASPAKYLKTVAYVDSTVLAPVGYITDVDLVCPAGMQVIGGGYYLIGSSALPFTKVTVSVALTSTKYRVEFVVDPASPVQEPATAQAICVGY